MQPCNAVFRRYARENDDERTGWPRDLEAGAPQDRDQQPGYDGRIKPLFGFGPAGDGKSHGQRQGYHADNRSGEDIR